METVIKEGTLRLHTTEASCDVILNCGGTRLMAHKLILSIASPMLRELLAPKNAETEMLIFPDVSGSTMSLILDYIYTGNVVLYTSTLDDFLSVARLLELKLDEEFQEKPKRIYVKNFECTPDVIFSRKNQKKLPNLVPINVENKNSRNKSRKSLCDYILPNPWKPRISTVLSDPKKDYPQSKEVLNENDKNNNFSNNNFYQSDLTKFYPIQENFYPLNYQLYNSAYPKSLRIQSTPPHFEEVQPQMRENPPNFDDKTNSNSSDSSLKDCNEDETAEDDEISVGEEFEKFDEKQNKTDKSKPFTCEDCGKSFSQLRNYKYHRSVHEGTKEFAAKCQECGKTFNDRGYLSSHMKIHRDKKEYACSHCPKRFNQRVAYNMHLRIHTGVKPHECQTCGKSFSRKMLLKQHQRVHTGERPYSCPECGKTFADRSNMSLHARLHTGVKPYACNLCPKSFTKKHHLKTHMNFHTGLKPYSCQKCGLSFSQSSNMRTHYKKCILKNTQPGTSSQAETSQENSDSNSTKQKT